MMVWCIVCALLWAADEAPRLFWGAVAAVTDRVAHRANRAVTWAHRHYGAAVEAL